MSFICSTCQKPAPRGMSPILSVLEAPKNYFTTDEKTGHRHMTGTGREVAREFKSCWSCAGQAVPTPPSTDFSAFKLYADGFALKHVRNCEGVKKVRKNGQEYTIPCIVCAGILQTYAEIPAQALSEVLAPTLAPSLKESTNGKGNTIAFNLIGGLIANEEAQRVRVSLGHSASKRQMDNFSAGYAVLSAFEKRGGALDRSRQQGKRAHA